MHRRDRPARLRRSRGGDHAAHEAARDRRRVERARHDQRRAARDRAGAHAPARSCSSTPCTTRRTRWSTCARSAATSSPARRTSSTGRTSACCAAAARCSRRSTRRSCVPRPTRRRSGSRPARRTTKAIVGAAAAVDFLAVARPAAIPPARAAPRRAGRAFDALHAAGRALPRAAVGRAGEPSPA